MQFDKEVFRAYLCWFKQILNTNLTLDFKCKILIGLSQTIWMCWLMTEYE